MTAVRSGATEQAELITEVNRRVCRHTEVPWLGRQGILCRSRAVKDSDLILLLR